MLSATEASVVQGEGQVKYPAKVLVVDDDAANLTALNEILSDLGQPIFRLACRLEALRRMLENPMPHAERLLRVLIREARRAPQLIQRYALATAHTNEYDKQDHRLRIDVYGACIDAPCRLQRFQLSSSSGLLTRNLRARPRRNQNHTRAGTRAFVPP